jgi:predicted DNA-binding protein YlxM (UPF0122 family)
MTEHQKNEPIHPSQVSKGEIIHEIKKDAIKDTIKDTDKVKAAEKNAKLAATKQEMTSLLDKMNEYLTEFNGESNIGTNHEYWSLLARYRLLSCMG